jgi:TolA-binding protein
MAQMRASAAKAAPADTPERELERIAGLRARGMHDEADKALAEFRKRYPDYKMSAAMLERVERR